MTDAGYTFIPFRPGMAWGPHMHRHPCPETGRLDAVLNGKAEPEPDPPRFRRVRLPDVKNSLRKFLTNPDPESKSQS